MIVYSVASVSYATWLLIRVFHEMFYKVTGGIMLQDNVSYGHSV